MATAPRSPSLILTIKTPNADDLARITSLFPTSVYASGVGGDDDGAGAI